ncbi:MAG: S8 family serine peptidase [Verrucomicrobiota bacterium]
MNRCFRSFFVFLIAFSTVAAQGQTKLGGGGTSPLLLSFINQDKTWFQDARQAYHGNDLVGGDGPMSRMDWTIVLTLHRWIHHSAINPGQPFVHGDDLYPLVNGNMLVEVVCEDGQSWQAVEPAMTNLGATGMSRDGLVINAWMPVVSMTAMSQLGGVDFIRPAYRTTRSAATGGLTVSQGDKAASADLARALVPGFSGEGITVGTLSDSFARATSPATTATQDVANGDLPPGIEVISEFGQAATDEGRGMMQIINDLAPGAAQKFYTAFNGQADFANGIRALATAGCDIIVDDVFYFAEPFFQNGLVAQAVNEVTEGGAVYFSAAGNSGRQSYESPFRAATGTTGLSGGPLHDFDPGAGVDTFLEITVGVGSSVTIIVQWDQPFFSVSGAPGCQSDIDVLVTGSGAGQFQALNGSLSNNVGGDALEILTFTNPGTIDIDGLPGADTQFNLVFERFTGLSPDVIKVLFFETGTFSVNEFDTQSSTLVGHANAQRAVAVAAAPYFNTPAFGVTPPLLEPFSSPGGSPLLFEDDGTRLAQPLDTAQPRITAPDGGNTTFFGSDLPSTFPDETDTFPNFFGTSAAAPHAAAVAALVLEKAGGPGSLLPSDVDRILRDSAIEMGTPGIDVESGAGLIDARAALEATPLGYPVWVRREFAPTSPLTLATDDGDGDGKSNAVEFFIGTDPEVADFVMPFTLGRSGDDFTLDVPVSPEVDPALGSILSSTDLITWETREDFDLASRPFVFSAASGGREFFDLNVETDPSQN